MKKETLYRVGFYFLGVASLSLGITLNTKTGLGLSAITSLPYAVSAASGIPFSKALLGLYIACVIIQLVLKGKKRSLRDLLQLPLSFLFSAIQDVTESAIRLDYTAPWQPYAVLPFAVLFTGMGVSLMVNMDLIPNPADGVPYVISGVIGRSMGFCKNLVDGACCAAALAVDLVFSGTIVSLGVGTVAAVVLNGRAIALTDHLFKKKMRSLAGLEK